MYIALFDVGKFKNFKGKSKSWKKKMSPQLLLPSILGNVNEKSDSQKLKPLLPTGHFAGKSIFS